MAETTIGVPTTTETPKKKKAPSTKKKRDAAMHPPRKTYLVEKCKVSGNKVTCTYRARSAFAKNVVDEFECSSTEHAELFAEHAPKVHARWKLSGLRYSLNKYVGPEGYERLVKSRKRAATRRDYRQKLAEERRRIRAAKEAAANRRREAAGKR